jgi:hypothetical protein
MVALLPLLAVPPLTLAGACCTAAFPGTLRAVSAALGATDPRSGSGLAAHGG